MLQRIQKFLSNQGLASRRAIEEWIKFKRLKVNGEIALLGTKVTGTEKFSLDDKILKDFKNSQEIKLLLYHKPIGNICTRSDPKNRPTVFEDLPTVSYGRWISIGRLDLNTSGLLLFTNDGDLAHRLMHPNFNQEREYLVRVYGAEITLEQLSLFTQGILLEDGLAKFKSITLINTKNSNNWYKVVLTEGRNREVKRLFAAQNLIVNRLIRIRFGNILLPKDLKPREFRFIKAEI